MNSRRLVCTLILWLGLSKSDAQTDIGSNQLSLPPLKPEVLAKLKANLPAVRLRITVPMSKKVPDSLTTTIQGYTPVFGVGNVPKEQMRMIEFRSQNFPDNTINLLRDTAPLVEVDRPPIFRPGVFAPFNLDAAKSHQVPQMVATFALKGGQGQVVAIFDEGSVRATHIEFLNAQGSSRISLKTISPLSRHSTHVAGTIGAVGVSPESQGMAPVCELLSYDWENDLQNLEQVAPSVAVSNHSYGPSAGWSFWQAGGQWLWWGNTKHSEQEDSSYGKYSQKSAALDDLLARNLHLVCVVAAGNERGRFVSPLQQPVHHFVLDGTEWVPSSKVRNKNAWESGGLDTISGMALAKNCITISAVNDISDSSPTPMTTDFSSWGPADDRRIKPDLSANGDRLFSTSTSSDDAYEIQSGTSMATPVTAGICALMAEMFTAKFQRKPAAAEIKGILIHTSRDAGPEGPDAMYGWGVLNAFEAGKFIKNAAENKTVLISENISNGDTKEVALVGDGERGRVTLIWTDPAGAPNPRGLDDTTSSLINDLDVTLTNGQSGQILHPYSLGGNGLVSATKNGKNSVDNVEVIDVAVPSGNWTLKIQGSRVTAGNAQSCTLLISGLKKLP